MPFDVIAVTVVLPVLTPRIIPSLTIAIEVSELTHVSCFSVVLLG